MGHLPPPLVSVPLPFVAAGGVTRPGPVARVFRGPADFSPALAKVVSVSKDVRAAIDVPGAVFHPAAGFSGFSSRATADAREYLERWNKSQMPFSAAFAAEYEGKDYAKYEQLATGVFWGTAAGFGLGAFFQYGWQLRPAEGVGGRVAEGAVRFCTGNGDNVGGVVTLLGGKVVAGCRRLVGVPAAAPATVQAAPEAETSPEFETALRAAREAAGASADGGEGGHADGYAWGTVLGMASGPVLQALIALADYAGAGGIDDLGPAGAFKATAYSSGDNIFGSAGSWNAMRKKYAARGMGPAEARRAALQELWAHPFHRANLAFIFAAFVGNVALRASGACPIDQQILTACEGAGLSSETLIASLWTKTRVAKLRAGLVGDVARPDDIGKLWAETVAK